MNEHRYQFSEVSGNEKTGPISTTMSQSTTCPVACPFRKQGCYAKGGHVRIHWDRLDRGESGLAWSDFLYRIARLHRGSMIRHNVAGDLEGNGRQINATKLAELTSAAKGKTLFAYTHHQVIGDTQDAQHNRVAIAAANKTDATINLSGNNLEHADKLKALGIAPVVTVLPADSKPVTFTPAGNKVVTCPAQTRDNVTCKSCRLCTRKDRSVIVGFLPHGNGRKFVNTVATKGQPAFAAA